MFTYKDYYDMVAVLAGNNRKIYFRHDVDISLDKALEMAEREYKMGLNPSAYFILPSSPYYNVFSKRDGDKIRTILDMGHKIGVHYDLSIPPDDLNVQADYVTMLKNDMELMFDTDIHTASCHKPFMGVAPTRDFAIELQKVGLHDVNLTMPDYKYISDSGMNWREDYREVVKANQRIHVNTHPEWYGDTEGTWQDRIKELNLQEHLDRLIRKELKDINKYHERLLRRDMP